MLQPERTVKVKDAQLFKTAVDLAYCLTEAELDITQPGGREEQIVALKGNYRDAFDALIAQASEEEKGNVGVVATAAFKARALIDHE